MRKNAGRSDLATPAFCRRVEGAFSLMFVAALDEPDEHRASPAPAPARRSHRCSSDPRPRPRASSGRLARTTAAVARRTLPCFQRRSRGALPVCPRASKPGTKSGVDALRVRGIARSGNKPANGHLSTSGKKPLNDWPAASVGFGRARPVGRAIARSRVVAKDSADHGRDRLQGAAAPAPSAPWPPTGSSTSRRSLTCAPSAGTPNESSSASRSRPSSIKDWRPMSPTKPSVRCVTRG